MIRFALYLYDFLGRRRWVGVCSLIAITLLIITLVSRLGYKEDIADFLPLNDRSIESLSVYQDISGADNIYAIFKSDDPNEIVAAIETFTDHLPDSIHAIAAVDISQMQEVQDFVYENMPYFLMQEDYDRMDGLLADPSYIEERIEEDKRQLMLPTGAMSANNIQHDPLKLFAPIFSVFKSQVSANYELYDGYIFSPDMSRAIVVIESPFGASETEKNTELANQLDAYADSMMDSRPDVEIHFTGAPIIAVGNASQIKRDSIVSVSISVVLILLLLLATIRNWRNILLILLSVGWGWLFALGGIALFHDNVSIIVIGISSVILGIAVNYPLHYIAHLRHTTDKRKALREIVTPLVVGNITTVGAFLALVPLKSVALSDLGLFSSLLLIGTILFSVLYLPHMARTREQAARESIPTSSSKITAFFDRIANVSVENKPVLVWIVVILTMIFGVFSFQTKFDSNMSHINYMTDRQRADMSFFQKEMMGVSERPIIYVAVSGGGEEALKNNDALLPLIEDMKDSSVITDYSSCHRFICSPEEQSYRLALWRGFVDKHKDLPSLIADASAREGFAEGSFANFFGMFEREYAPQALEYFSYPLSPLLASNLSIDKDEGKYSFVSALTLKDKKGKATVEEKIEQLDGAYCFDTESMNSSIANHLSNNFNYIGWACGFIVFFFLWLSLGSIELAVLSFIPMAVSWVWILGIMAILGIQFNIVNIILATFIFGQGDDYTIFMTEGACYEYAYKKKMLSSYKHAIMLSALIMLIGIGSLIIAKHPALRSLAQVTIAGMFSVVLMSALFPPLMFKFLVTRKGEYRRRPLSLRPFCVMALATICFFAQLASAYILGFILFQVRRPTEKSRMWFRRYIQKLYSFDLAHIPTVKYSIRDEIGENFSAPSVIVCNHQSMLDAAVFMSLNPKLILISNKNVSSNGIIRHIFKWMGHISLQGDSVAEKEKLGRYVANGYSFVIFPEGERNDKSSIKRFHKGAFLLAEQLQLDIVTVFLHGFNEVLPRNSVCLFPGILTVSIRKRIKLDDSSWGCGYVERTRRIHKYYVEEYNNMARTMEDTDYFVDFVRDRYRYKGVEVFSAVSRKLRQRKEYHILTDATYDEGTVVISGNVYGELAILFALTHRDLRVIAVCDDVERLSLIKFCAEGVADNLIVSPSSDLHKVMPLGEKCKEIEL